MNIKRYEYVLVKTTLGYLIIDRVTNGVFLIENENAKKVLQSFESHGHLMNKCTRINIVSEPIQPAIRPRNNEIIPVCTRC